MTNLEKIIDAIIKNPTNREEWEMLLDAYDDAEGDAAIITQEKKMKEKRLPELVGLMEHYQPLEMLNRVDMSHFALDYKLKERIINEEGRKLTFAVAEEIMHLLKIKDSNTTVTLSIRAHILTEDELYLLLKKSYVAGYNEHVIWTSRRKK